MNTICEKCMTDPTSHSFKRLVEKDGVVVYYTNPSKSTLYKDTEGILNHYINALETIGDKKWVWIFDSEGFDINHALEVHTGIGIAKIVSGKYGQNLQEIKLINPTWHIQTMLLVIWPFLNNTIKQKINIMSDRPYSVLEFI